MNCTQISYVRFNDECQSKMSIQCCSMTPDGNTLTFGDLSNTVTVVELNYIRKECHINEFLTPITNASNKMFKKTLGHSGELF